MAYKWYIINAYSGSEKAVEKSIRERALKVGLEGKIEDIVVPTKKVTQVKKGKKVEVEKNFYPGYVFIKVDLTDDIWHTIRQVPKVSGFVSNGGAPQSLPQSEVDQIIDQMESDDVGIVGGMEFDIGQSVKVNDGGPFDGFVGVIEEIDKDKKQLSISVSIFGRATAVKIGWDQVEKE
jgi:transcriptional antiterminator NusG